MYFVQYLGPDRGNINEAAKRIIDLYKQVRVLDTCLLIILVQERDLVTFVRAETQLQRTLSPLYMKLFGWLVQKDDGLKLLIDMRSDLLVTISPNQFIISCSLLLEIVMTIKGLLLVCRN